MQLNTLNIGLDGGSMLQSANRCPYQSMSYVLTTPEQKVVVIDGGDTHDPERDYLLDIIKQRGGVVDLWLITHAHRDHFGALSKILQDYPGEIEIKDLRFTFPELDWIYGIGQQEGDLAKDFLQAVKAQNINCKDLNFKDSIDVGSVNFEILNDPHDYKDYHNLNATTAVILAHYPSRDILFLGDLDKESEPHMLKICDKSKLRCDVVQMAHHGQNGVSREFYELVQPKLCLYTAPDWLYDCDNGGGKGSGPWATLETRRWCKELGSVADCPTAYGDYLFY